MAGRRKINSRIYPGRGHNFNRIEFKHADTAARDEHVSE